MNQQPESTNHLKCVYEQSLAVLRDGRGAADKNTESAKTLRATLPLHIDAESLQKRALDDAAKALSTLWKVSGAKLPARVISHR